jgi:hypothetical protein
MILKIKKGKEKKESEISCQQIKEYS